MKLKLKIETWYWNLELKLEIVTWNVCSSRHIYYLPWKEQQGMPHHPARQSQHYLIPHQKLQLVWVKMCNAKLPRRARKMYTLWQQKKHYDAGSGGVGVDDKTRSNKGMMMNILLKDLLDDFFTTKMVNSEMFAISIICGYPTSSIGLFKLPVDYYK